MLLGVYKNNARAIGCYKAHGVHSVG